MKKITLIHALLFISLNVACSSSASVQNNGSNAGFNSSNSNADPAKSQKIETEDKPDKELQNQIEQIASLAEGRVGVAAKVLETGETVSLNARERFPMQSVYKFPIAMAVLRLVDDGKLQLNDAVRVEKTDFVRRGMHSPIRDANPNGVETTIAELLRFSVSESDGTASDVLLKSAGGAEAVGKYLNEIGIVEVTVADSEKGIGQDWETQYRNWATPEGAVGLLGALNEGRGLSDASRALLLKLMIESPTGTNRLKGLLPKDAVVAHKTGTSGTQNGITAATNDIGIVTLPNGRHLAIAVFVSDSSADEKTRESTIAKIAKAAWDEWSR